MSNEYHKTLVVLILVCLIAPYFWVNGNQLNSDSKETIFTTYKYISVAGPIQPIPELEKFNLKQVLLGKALFNSPLLSHDNTISCASCHMVGFGGDDGFPVSTGTNNKKGDRNSPTVLNAVFSFKQFWDGRENTLSQQVAGPIHNPIEMSSNWNEIISKLSQDEYFSNQFSEVYSDIISPKSITEAIVAYEATLITPNSPFDKFIQGDDSALTAQQKQGYMLFKNYGCSTCHQGINIGGNIFQKLGKIQKSHLHLENDLGRYEVTKNINDKHVFKVPSLRNIELTAPYFHDGSIETLEEAVQIMARMQLGRELSISDNNDIVALLHSFTGSLAQVK